MSTLEETFVIGGNTVTVRAPGGKKGALPVVYLNVFQGDGAEVWGRLGELGCAPLALVAVGIANMWAAIFADVGVMILAVLNAIRALRYKE